MQPEAHSTRDCRLRARSRRSTTFAINASTAPPLAPTASTRIRLDNEYALAMTLMMLLVANISMLIQKHCLYMKGCDDPRQVSLPAAAQHIQRCCSQGTQCSEDCDRSPRPPRKRLHRHLEASLLKACLQIIISQRRVRLFCQLAGW